MSRRSSARSSIPTVSYHGAHKPPVEAPAVDRWEGNGVVAFHHDLLTTDTLPSEYKSCDVLVTDLPWQKGYETFNDRAGVHDDRTYASFMARIAELAEKTPQPLYLVTGRHAITRLPKADAVLPTRLNEDDAVIIGYRAGAEVDGTYGVAPEFLHALAQRYECAGDFCCGYGRTGRFFLRAGKRAVLSDFNAQCIGYVSEHAPAWLAG